MMVVGIKKKIEAQMITKVAAEERCGCVLALVYSMTTFLLYMYLQKSFTYIFEVFHDKFIYER